MHCHYSECRGTKLSHDDKFESCILQTTPKQKKYQLYFIWGFINWSTHLTHRLVDWSTHLTGLFDFNQVLDRWRPLCTSIFFVFSVRVPCSQSKGLSQSTTLKRSSEKFREWWDSNPGPLGQKRERYLCAMQPNANAPQDGFITSLLGLVSAIKPVMQMAQGPFRYATQNFSL